MGRILLLVSLWLAAMVPVQAETIYGRVFETLKGSIYPNVAVTLMSNPPRQTTTDQYGQYWFKDVKAGAYLMRVKLADRPAITSRLLVYKGTTVANLDLSKILDPEHGDEY